MFFALVTPMPISSPLIFISAIPSDKGAAFVSPVHAPVARFAAVLLVIVVVFVIIITMVP